MPLYEFQCTTCCRSEERLYPSYRAMVCDVYLPSGDTTMGCDLPQCDGKMQRVLSGSLINVTGYNAKNGYCGGGKWKETTGTHKDMRVRTTHF